MSKDTDTIQDKDGDVFTGRVTDDGSPDAADMVAEGIAAIGTGGLTLLLPNGEPQVTVEVNDEEHTGTSVEK